MFRLQRWQSRKVPVSHWIFKRSSREYLTRHPLNRRWSRWWMRGYVFISIILYLKYNNENYSEFENMPAFEVSLKALNLSLSFACWKVLISLQLRLHSQSATVGGGGIAAMNGHHSLVVTSNGNGTRQWVYRISLCIPSFYFLLFPISPPFEPG